MKWGVPKKSRSPVRVSVFIKTEKTRTNVGGRYKVSMSRVMKNKDKKVEEIKVSHTLGGVGEGHVQGRGKRIGYT